MKIRLGFTCLCFLMIFGFCELAHAQEGQQDAHKVFSFTTLPDPNYYFREFALEGLKPVRDATKVDSDQIIRDHPQSPRGFLPSWIQPGQTVVALPEDTEFTMVDASGGLVKAIIKKNEPVLVDARNLSQSRVVDVLAVIRCANKAVEGKFRLPEPETKVVERTVEKVIERVVEKPVRVEVEKPCDPDWSWGIIGEYYPKNSKAKKVRLDPAKFITFPEDGETRNKIVEAINAEDEDFFKRKVQFAAALYNICQPKVRLYWYREGWHWKEFFIGVLPGFAGGFFVGRVTKEVTKLPVKPPFLSPERPMTLLPAVAYLAGKGPRKFSHFVEELLRKRGREDLLE